MYLIGTLPRVGPDPLPFELGEASHEPGSKLLVLGMGDLQPSIGNPYFMGPYFHPYGLGLSFVYPLLIWKTMGVDRPWHRALAI